METNNIVTNRQLRAIDELFESGGNENAVLQKLSISPDKWKRWRTQPLFNRALEAKMKTLNQNSQMLLFQHSSWVTARLLELCNSEKDEVSRKACFNVLQLNNKTIEKIPPQPDDAEDTEPNLTPEQASRILAALVEPSRDEPVESACDEPIEPACGESVEPACGEQSRTNGDI